MLSRTVRRRPAGVLRRLLAAVVRVLRLSLMIVMVGPARGLGATPQVDDPDVREHPERVAGDVSPGEAEAEAEAEGLSARR